MTLYVDGEAVGEGRVDATVPMVFSADETCDVGSDTGSPVADDYSRATRVHRQGQLGADRHRRGREDHDHLITPEERLRVAMARQ